MQKNQKRENLEIKLINMYKIHENEDFTGYFVHAAMSRSGHNFIKGNIMSWTEKPPMIKRKYINSENPDEDRLYKLEPIYGLTNSIQIMTIRSLLNWYTSFFYFSNQRALTEGDDINKKRTREFDIFIHKADLEKNPELWRNPRVCILQDDESEKNFMTEIEPPNFNRDAIITKMLSKWLFLAKEYTGATSKFPYYTKIYYDKFFLSKEYRMEVCKKLRGDYNEFLIDKVPNTGGGSTFDKTTFQGNGHQMGVLKRWVKWKPEHYKYLEILKQHEAYRFYLDNFDVPQEEIDFMNNI